MRIFALHAKDFYKATHVHQSPMNSKRVYSNFTPRSGKWSNVPNNDGVVFTMLQLFILDYLISDWNDTFFSQDKQEVCKKYYRRLKNGVGGEIDVSHIGALHDLGYLPLHIKALPEGSLVPYGVPMFTLVNTHDDFYWLTNMIESVLSADIWGGCTSATTSNAYRKLFERYALATGGDIDFVPFQGHDFSFRGMWGKQATALSGFGHLISGLCGTDSIPAIDLAEDFYGANSDIDLIGCSVNATEHAIMCSGIAQYEKEISEGKHVDEIEYYMNFDDSDDAVDYKEIAEYLLVKHLITVVYPTGIFSIVSDSFDFWRLVNRILPRLKDVIMGRDGKIVIRPDSGDPIRIIAGYTDDEIIRNDGKFFIKMSGEVGSSYSGEELMECEVKGLVECLSDVFGGTTTSNNFRLLDSHIGAIYGDSITYQRAEEILERLKDKNFTSTNIVFGIGSYTFTGVSRDSHGFAMKATNTVVGDDSIAIFKDPKTDDGTKKSAKGLLRVDFDKGRYVLTDQCTPEEEAGGELKTVFLDGKITKEWTLAEIRATVRSFD